MPAWHRSRTWLLCGAMARDRVRLGLIGCGHWGRNFISTLVEFDDARLDVIATLSGRPIGLPTAIAVVSDWRRLIEEFDLDGVIIATPPELHAEMAAAAVTAGRPVLLEKPVSLDLPSAEWLLELTQRTGGTVLVDHVRLFSPAYRALKRLIGQDGPMVKLRGTTGNPTPPRGEVSALWDLGPHEVAMAIDLIGQPPVHAYAERGVDGAIHLAMEFENGVHALSVVGAGFPQKRRELIVDCVGARFRYDDTAAVPLVRQKQGGPIEPISVSSARPLSCAVRAFVDLIRGQRTDNPSSLELGVQVVNVLARCETGLLRSAGAQHRGFERPPVAARRAAAALG